MSTPTQAKTKWKLDPSHSSVKVAVNHLAIGRVRIPFRKLEITLEFDGSTFEDASIQARIGADSFDSGDPKRDGHLKSADFLDVENHPWITFTSGKIVRQDQDTFEVTGDLTLREVMHPVTLKTTLSQVIKDMAGDPRVAISAQATFDKRDFKIDWNMALEGGTLLVGNSVLVSIEAELAQQTE